MASMSRDLFRMFSVVPSAVMQISSTYTAFRPDRAKHSNQGEGGYGVHAFMLRVGCSSFICTSQAEYIK